MPTFNTNSDPWDERRAAAERTCQRSGSAFETSNTPDHGGLLFIIGLAVFIVGLIAIAAGVR